MSDPVYDHVRVEPKRDRWGRYLINGKPYTRVTTFAEAVDDRYNLEAWKQRMVALGLVARHDLYAQVAATPTDDRKTLNRLCGQAVEAAKGSAGANLGTALHRFTERLDMGEDVHVPPPWDQDVAAYKRTLDANRVRVNPAMVERIVVHHGLGVAGTFDRLVEVEGYDLPLIADVKTGATLDFSWGAIAIQLACYAHAEQLYDPATDSLHPIPEINPHRALVIHLPAGTGDCDLYTVDLTAGWEAAQLCGQVREWRKRKDLNEPFRPVDDLAARRAWLRERIAGHRDTRPDVVDTLAAIWPEGVPTLRQDGHTHDQLDAISTALSHAEAKHRVPFPTRPEPSSAAPRDAIDAVIGRLAALPADLLLEVSAEATAAGVPNLRGYKATTGQIETLNGPLERAEAEAQRRLAELEQALTDVCEDDSDLRGALLVAVHVDRPPTQEQVDAIRAVRAAIDARCVAFACTDNGTWQLTAHVDPLKDLYGGGREALAALKQLAGTHGYDRPRSLADAAANPALIALAAASANQPTHDSTEAA